MADGAKIYFEDWGAGQPIVLVHGWTCSSKFWRKNVAELCKQFRVVTLDLRGHGNSSKILTGHTITEYARDVRRLIEALELRDVTLAGWSLGGPVILSYYDQYAAHSRLKALALVDTAPHPFSSAEWNRHALRNWNMDAMHATFGTYTADPKAFAIAFTRRMFKAVNVSDEDVQWISAELARTPPWIAMAAYSDFLIADYANVLPSIKLPVAVFAADSEIYKNGIEMGKAIAAQVPCSKFFPFEDAGHLLFYEKPEKFNRALSEFVMAIR